MIRRAPTIVGSLLAGLLLSGCHFYEYSHPIYWDARGQIWAAEASQVKVRAAQSRIFDTTDKRRMLEAAVMTFQDLEFQVDVLDEALGIISGKKFVAGDGSGGDPYYHLYDDESLIAFTRAYRTWGPFYHRNDLVRLTLTVRQRNETQLIVRASAQHELQPLESPEPYQAFFRTLEQSLFLERELKSDGGAPAEGP